MLSRGRSLSGNISPRATNPCCTISWVITDFLYFPSDRNMRAFQPFFYRNYCIYPWAKYVAYATSLPVQHHLCCYCIVYGKESYLYNNEHCRVVVRTCHRHITSIIYVYNVMCVIGSYNDLCSLVVTLYYGKHNL